MIIEERIDNIAEDLGLFDEDLEKYEYIVDLGKKLKKPDEELLKDEFLVRGCTSKVWLVPMYQDGLLHFNAYSNSVIVKGLVSIIVTIFQDLSPETINSFNVEHLNKLEISEIVSPTRQNGLSKMVERIRHYGSIYGGSHES